MTVRRRPMVAGNWKMNGLAGQASEIKALGRKIARARSKPKCDILICPPATLIATFKPLVSGLGIGLGGQDCHARSSGAHTGDISAEMLKNAGAKAVVVGHSERRADHGETSLQVRAKAMAAHRAGLVAIICVGETGRERKAGKTLRVVGAQLKGSMPNGANARNTVIAYEPVWAIGTGLTPSAADIAAVHKGVRARLAKLIGEQARKMRILYGGSVKPANARELMAIDNVDGALVGGASLKASDFFAIIETYS